jgi:dihydrofolate reductase
MPGGTPRVIYRTATSLDGFLADTDNSLAWLFAVEQDEDQPGQHEQFLQDIGVLVKGSTTYEWFLREADLLAHPEKWQGYYSDRPTFVFTTRALPRPAGADVRFMAGRPQDALPAIRAAAAGRDIWMVGGGDLAGQFFDAGALDQIDVSIAPVTLAAGAPLLPRRIDSTRLRLIDVARQAQFIVASYAVEQAPSSPA